MNKLMWTVSAVLISSLLTTACTREEKKNTSISFSLKDFFRKSENSTQTGGTAGGISHVVVNISPGPLVFNFDRHRHGQTIDLGHTFVIPDIPKGTNRLVQILVVSDDGSGSETFSYGDVLKDLVANEETLNIAVSNISHGTGVEGQVGGRYLNAGGASGPTGVMDLLFDPEVSNRPIMKVMEFGVVNGWFNIFLIDGAKFSYKFKHNNVNFFAGTNLSIDDETFTPTSTKNSVLHIVQPAGKAVFNNGGGPTTIENRGEERYIVGFFGPGVSSEAICYNTNNGPVPNMYTSYVDAGDNTPMIYNSGSTDSTTVHRVNYNGGVSNSAGLCDTGGTEYQNILRVDPKNIGSGKGRTYGFENIFKVPVGQYNPIQSSFASNSLTLSWAFLPGVIGPNGVDGVEIFLNKHPSESLDDFGGDGVDCVQLGNMGYVPAGRITSQATQTYSISMSSAEYANAEIGICPFKNGSYFKGVNARIQQSGGGGGSGGPMLNFANSDGTGPVITLTPGAGSCHAFKIVATTAPTGANLTVNLSASGVSGLNYFDSAPDCAAGTPTLSPSEVTINIGATASNVFYFRGDNQGYANLQGTASGGYSGAYHDIGLLGGAATKLAVSSPLNPMVESCYRIWVKLQTAANYPATYGSAVNVTLSNTVAGSSLYSSNSCMGGTISTISIAAGEHAKELYFKATSLSSGTISATDDGSVLTSGATSTITPESNQISQYSLSIPALISNYTPGTCYEVKARAENSNGSQVMATSAITLAFETYVTGPTPVSHLYSDSGCTVGISSTMAGIIPSYSWESDSVYIKAAGGTYTLKVLSTTPAAVGTRSINY